MAGDARTRTPVAIEPQLLRERGWEAAMADESGTAEHSEVGADNGVGAPDAGDAPVASPELDDAGASDKPSRAAARASDAAEAGSDNDDVGGEEDNDDDGDDDADMDGAGDDDAEDSTLGTADNPLPKLRRPLTAYFMFAAAKRKEVRASKPGGSVASEAKLIGALWKSLTPEEKAVSVSVAGQQAWRPS